MRDYLITAAISFLAAIILAPLLIGWLKKLKVGQKILEDGPTWHMSKQGTPTMGGIIFIIAAAIPVLLRLPQMLEADDFRSLLALLLSLVFGAVGMIDDWTKIRKKTNKGITAMQKLLLQIAAATLFLSVMRYMGYLSHELFIPFFNVTVSMPWSVYLVLSVLFIVGFDNAVNLTDGIDGLCTSVTLIITVFFAAVFIINGNSAPTFALALSGALLGFFLFNKHPARVFMGDTGSLFLGGAVCAMAFTAENPLLLVIVGLIYLIETASVILQIAYFKISGGKRLFKMAPIHHHFEKCGWSEWKIVIIACAITVIMCLLAYIS